MTKNLFFARAAKTIFAFATVVMMSTAFASYSKDNDEPKFTGTVTVNGVERPIVKAEYTGNQSYTMYLYLSDDGVDKVILEMDKLLHMSGSPIDLTEKETPTLNGEYHWMVGYYKSSNTASISVTGSPDVEKPVFETGTLTVKGNPATGIDIKLDYGRVIGTDGNTVYNINCNGPMTQEISIFARRRFETIRSVVGYALNILITQRLSPDTAFPHKHYHAGFQGA